MGGRVLKNQLVENECPKIVENKGFVVNEFRSVKIRKDVFELLKLYCLCNKTNPKELVTSILESKLEGFRLRLEELRKEGLQK